MEIGCWAHWYHQDDSRENDAAESLLLSLLRYCVLFLFLAIPIEGEGWKLTKFNLFLGTDPHPTQECWENCLGKTREKGVHAQQLRPGALISHKLWRNHLVINLGNTWQYKIFKVTKFG